jgi:antirestriction protein ArdC
MTFKTKSKSKKNFVKVDNYQEVTNEIIKALESGKTLPWVKPWKTTGTLRNAFTNRPYRGLNTIILGMQPYSDPRWATYNQIKKNGGNVKKGESGTKVVLWKFIEDKKNEGKIIPLLRTFTIFNVSQAEFDESSKLPTLAELMKKGKENLPDTREDLEKVIKDTGAILNFGGNSAHYSPSTDEVTMPTIESFKDSDSYYSVFFHELGHWSGAKSRLDREGIVEFDSFGSEQYAFEELVAELTSAFIGRDLSFDGTFQDNHAGYIKSWIKVLKDDKRAIFKASSQAEKAAKFIMGSKAPKFEEENE